MMMTRDTGGFDLPQNNSLLPSQDPLMALHRQIYWVMLGTIGLLSLICYSLINAVFASKGWVVIFPCIILGMGWSAFRNKKLWAYPFAVGLNAVGVMLFALIGLFLIISLDGFSILIGVLMIFSSVQSWRRLTVMRNPLFKAWYLGLNIPMMGMGLDEGEIYASCPHCSSVLAIQPTKLTVKDTCPSCHGPLISGETIRQLNEEE